MDVSGCANSPNSDPYSVIIHHTKDGRWFVRFNGPVPVMPWLKRLRATRSGRPRIPNQLYSFLLGLGDKWMVWSSEGVPAPDSLDGEAEDNLSLWQALDQLKIWPGSQGWIYYGPRRRRDGQIESDDDSAEYE